MNIVSYTSIDDFKLFKKNKEYTGHELFSLIIPSKININRGGVEIQNGILKKGQLSKEFLGSKKKNALHQLIWDEYGVEETKDFMDNVNRLVNNFNLYNGFTVGIKDIDVPKNVEAQIQNLFQTKDMKVSHMITEVENNPELMTEDLYERTLFAELNNVLEDVSKLIMQNLKPTNNFGIMINSGSKGEGRNMGQISGCVGMQAFEGKLIPKIVNRRTLPYYFQNDDRAESRGLVKRPYIYGMTYPEFFYHNMTGRSGLIDSAVKTAESGYIQRKLVKSMEDVMIKYDRTVRSANNAIVQFIYGDTGADTIKQYEYNVKLLEMGDTELSEKYKIKSSDLNKMKITKENNDRYFEEIKELRDTLRTSQVKYRMDYKTLGTVYMIPINLPRIIDNTRNTAGNEGPLLDAQYIMNKLNDVLDNSFTRLACIHNKDVNNKDSIKYQDEKTSKTSFRVALLDALSPARCIYDYKLSKIQFDSIIDDIISSYNRSIAEAGEMVGIIAAQSMGEPTTQMTLNSFHSAGIAAIGSVTQGVPRIKELLSLAKKIKTPQMIIYLTKENMASREMANKISSYIKFTTLGHIIKKITVNYDPDPSQKDSFMDKDNVKNIYYTHNPNKNSCQVDINGLPWLMRIELDREKMLEKEVTLLDIKSKFCNSWEKRYADMKNMKKEEKYVLDQIAQLAIISNTDNDRVPMIHIRFEMKDYDIMVISQFIEHIIDKFKLKGIPSINDIATTQEERVLYFDGPNHDVEKKTQFAIYTAGINLTDIRYITGIDPYRTICNDVIAMYETFGIEAARATLAREIAYAYERAGSAVNYHHLSVLVDLMTVNGYLTSIDRHGMNKSDIDPLSRASFEKTVDQLTTAAVFGEIDHMKGVSSRIIAGLVIKGGTGMCDLILDTDMLEKSEYTIDIGQKYEKTYIPVNKSNVNDHFIKEEDDTGLFIPLD